MKVNCHVGATVSFVNLAAIVTGLCIGGFSGILEMDGFKDTFSELYADSSNLSNQSSSNRTTRGCSSGNGASSDSMIGIIVSIYAIGSLCGSLIAGWVSDKVGRNYGLSLGGVVMVLGAIILSTSYFVWMLVLGRTFTGIAVGIFYVVMPVYIAEMTPKETRGMLSSTIGLTQNLGLIVAFVLNIGFEKFRIGWRVSLAILAALAMTFAIGMMYMPHTPRWLLKRNRDHEALQALTKINHSSGTETFVDTYLELEELRAANVRSTFNLKALYQRKYRLLVTSVILVLNPPVGVHLYYYSTTIFCEVGVSPFISTLVLGLVVSVSSIAFIFFIDRIGRKALALICTLGIGLDGLITAILIHVYDSPTKVVEYAIVLLICIYAFGLACSWVTLPWIINSEIFPTNIRAITAGIGSCVFWLSAFITNQVTPLIIGSPLQLHGIFYFASGFNFVAFLFILFALPETKGVSLEKMDELFSQSIYERFINTFRGDKGVKVKQVEVLEESVKDTELDDIHALNVS